MYIAVYVVQLLYYLWSIPFRLGFIFDPYDHASDVAYADIVWPYLVLDIAADSFGAVNFYYFVQAQRMQSPSKRGGSETSKTWRNSTSSHHAPRLGGGNVAGGTTSSSLVRPHKTGRRSTSIDSRNATVSFRHLHFITSISARTLAYIPSFQLLLEGIALLPMDIVAYYVGGVNAVHVSRLPKLLRLINLGRVVSAFKTYLATHNLLVQLHNIAKGFLVTMALFNLIVFHWIGCGYMLAAHLECGRYLDLCEPSDGSNASHQRRLSGAVATVTGKTCWAIEKQLGDLNLFAQYVRTMLIVTYGDATSYSFAERCMSICIQVARALMSCALIGGFELVHGHQNTSRSAYIALVEDARESRNLPVHLRNKVLGYFDYFWRVQLGILETNVIATLPIHFQTQCIDVLKAQVIARVHFLADERPNVIQNLATLLTSQVYMPLDWITKTARVREMSFISRGRVVLVDKLDNIQFKLTQGDTFGDIALFVEHGFAYKALAETFCELYQLNRDVFETVLGAFYTQDGALEAKKAAMAAAIEQREHQLLKTQKLLGQTTSLTTLLASHDRSAGKWTLPNSKFRTTWSALYLASLVYVAVEVPYKLIFSNSENVSDFLLNTLNYASAMGMELFHGAHIILMMRYFAFEDKSSIVNTAPVVDSDLIFARYKESKDLWWDLAAVVPIALVGDLIPQDTYVAVAIGRRSNMSFANRGAFVNVLRAGRILRLLRLRYFQSVLSDVLEAYHVSTSMQTVVYLSMGVLLVTHIAGCFWFFIADMQVPRAVVYGMDWVRSDLTLSKYPRSLFWSVMTLTSVGYGVIFPFTTAECVYAFVWFYLSGLINFGVIGAISSAIAQLMANENRTQDTLLLINRFMKFKGVSPTVQADIRRYYKNQWVREKGVSEEMFLSVLPDNVQHEILTFLHAETLHHVSLFRDTGDECKQVIASIIRHESYQAGDYVLHAGDLGCDLYILRSGNVELRTAQRTPMRILHPGDCYGEFNFVLEVPYNATVQVMVSTELSVLRRNEFDQIIKFFPDEWEYIYNRALVAQAHEESLWARMQANMRRDKLINLTQHSVTLYVQPPRETGVIPPTHPFRRAWTVILATAILYNLFLVVFRLAFLQYPSPDTMSALWTSNLLFDGVYFVDMYLNYWHFTVDLDGFVHLDMADSRAHYRKHKFRRDVVASLPLYYVGNTYVMAWCRVPRLVRSMELPAMTTRLQLWIQERVVSAKLSAILRLVKLLLALIAVAHVTGAIYYFLGDPAAHAHDDVASSHEWFVIDLIIRHYDGNAVVAYIRSFYWALTTVLVATDAIARMTCAMDQVTAMDYRDIHPASNIETYYTCLACFGGFFFVGQVIGQLTSIIVHMDKEANEFDERIENFDEYARSQNLPQFLLERGHQYFEYQFDCTRGMEADVIFSELPHSLRMKLFYDLYGSRLRGISLFYTMDAATLASIAERLIPVLYLPHDNIIVEGGIGAALYIMHQGRAEKYVRVSNLVVAAVHEGTMFGELAFFLPHTTHATSVRAVTCCELLRLEKADWIGLWPLSRRRAIEDAMQTELRLKHEYLTSATKNILKNLISTKRSKPNAKVRKQILSSLRRMSTYGRNRLIVFKELAATSIAMAPLRDKLRPRQPKAKNSSSRIHPVRSDDESTGPVIKPMKKPKPQRTIKSSFKRESPNTVKRMRNRLNSVQLVYASDSAHSTRSSRSVNERSSNNSSLPPAYPGEDLKDEDVADVEVLDETDDHFQHLNLLRRASIGSVTPHGAPDLVEMASIWGDLRLPTAWTRPHSFFRKLWDMVMLAVVMYYSVAIPMRACFIDLMGAAATNAIVPLWLGVEFAVDGISLVDVYFRFNYFCQVIGGEVSSDLRLIRHHYRTKGNLWCDIAASLPLELIAIALHGPSHDVSIWRVNKLLRLVHVGSLSAKTRDTITLRFKSVAWLPQLWSFCDIFAVFLVVGHWVACLWFYVSVASGDASSVFYAHLPEAFVSPHAYTSVDTLQSAYVKSFYYAMTSLSSITFGDIFPTSLAQTIATIFIIFVSLTAYGVLTGGFSEMFEVEFKNRFKFEEQTSTVSMFLMHRQFPRHLTIQILEYFRNMWEHSEGVVEAQALASLSSALREDIAVYVKRDLITKVRLFSECDQDFTRAIVSVLQAEFFVAKDVIIREGDYERSMYFIHTGFVLVTNEAKSYEVIKQKGEYFGELSLLHNTPRSGSCSAISNCDMFILDHDSYEYVLERFPHYRARNLRNWCAAAVNPLMQLKDVSASKPGTPFTHHETTDDTVDVAPDGDFHQSVTRDLDGGAAALQLQSISDHEQPANEPPEADATLSDTSPPFDVDLLKRTSQLLTRDSLLHSLHSRTLHPASSVHRDGIGPMHVPPAMSRQSTASKLRETSSHARDLRHQLAVPKSSLNLNANAVLASIKAPTAGVDHPMSEDATDAGNAVTALVEHDVAYDRTLSSTFSRREARSQPTMDSAAMRRVSAVWDDVQASPRFMQHQRAHSLFHVGGIAGVEPLASHAGAVVITNEMAANAAKIAASSILRSRAVHTAAASSSLDGMARRLSIEHVARTTPR
ncbi:hypothetical protein DYB32_005028 [Aphanomyces invadans]|uniref:Cyclic nucleotide-binding domain-containing protein n=1 Tax=Aphanomyces invadans TaxID=157072 RepID=A0A3R6YYU2_9STRA|nr:hypothetical protein DYB32_005028 [Aphanomyces invadans]